MEGEQGQQDQEGQGQRSVDFGARWPLGEQPAGPPSDGTEGVSDGPFRFSFQHHCDKHGTLAASGQTG